MTAIIQEPTRQQGSLLGWVSARRQHSIRSANWTAIEASQPLLHRKTSGMSGIQLLLVTGVICFLDRLTPDE